MLMSGTRNENTDIRVDVLNGIESQYDATLHPDRWNQLWVGVCRKLRKV